MELTGDKEIQATSSLSVPGRQVIPAVIADHPRSKGVDRYTTKIAQFFGRL